MFIEVGAFSEETAYIANRLAAAFARKGYASLAVTGDKLLTKFAKDKKRFYIAVVSDKFNFIRGDFLGRSLKNFCVWYVDSDSKERFSTFETTASYITVLGGLVFSAQYEDFTKLVKSNKVNSRIAWLNLAADDNVHSYNAEFPRGNDVMLVGDVKSPIFSQTLDLLKRNQLRVVYTSSDYPDDKTVLYRTSKCAVILSGGLVIPNMYEALSCGTPIVVGNSENIRRSFYEKEFVVNYTSLEDIPARVKDIVGLKLASEQCVTFVKSSETYNTRANQIILAACQNEMSLDCNDLR